MIKIKPKVVIALHSATALHNYTLICVLIRFIKCGIVGLLPALHTKVPRNSALISEINDGKNGDKIL